jgi:hypothetical protein
VTLATLMRAAVALGQSLRVSLSPGQAA